MARKRHTPEQIIRMLREAVVELAKGRTTTDVVRKLGTEPEARRLRGRSHNGANGLGHLRLVHRPGELA